MSDLQTYDRIDNTVYGFGIASVDRRAGRPMPPLEPGTYVEVPGRGGFGMVVAVSENQVSVLWSKRPAETRPVPPPPWLRPKQAQVTATDTYDPDIQALSFADRGLVSKAFVREQFDLEETYDGVYLPNEQLDELRKESHKIEYRDNGDIVVKRTVETLPHYVKPSDVKRGLNHNR